MTQHDYYEELCALAVTGQIAPDQLKSLKEHMETCASCLNTFADFDQVAGHVMEFAGRRTALDPPSGMTDRFIARAHSEGIPLSRKANGRETARSKKWLRNSAYALAAGMILFVGLRILLAERRSAMRAEATHETRSGPAADSSPRPDLLHENAALAQQVESLQKQLNELVADLKAKQQAIEVSNSEKLQVRARSARIENDDAVLRQGLVERDARIAGLNAEAAQNKQQIDQLLAGKSAGDFRLQTAQSELNDLREKVASLNEEIDKNQQLSAAAEEAKDLIVARNLHIVDVHDNANGSRPGPFGRIFYTEGKKLVFYAYDLGDPRQLNAKVSFWVWGEKAGTVNKPKHLGILQTDDRQDGRWVVTFDDPRVLAQINTVFVTAESASKQIRQPNGNRILVAFLDGEPNHP